MGGPVYAPETHKKGIAAGGAQVSGKYVWPTKTLSQGQDSASSLSLRERKTQQAK